MREQPFTITLLVQIEGFGLPSIHRSNIIDRVDREMRLAFGSHAHVYETQPGPIHNGQTLWVPRSEVVPKEVQQVGEEAQVPEVWTPKASTGTRLRSLPDHVLAVRVPVQNISPNGGTP